MKKANPAPEPAILIVDDDPQVRELFDCVLAQEKLKTLTAENADEARLKLAKNNVAVIICDHHLPGEDGLSFLAKLRVSHPALQRILMTAYSCETTAMRSINEAQVMQYLIKPCMPHDLINIVNKAFQRAEEEKKLRAQHRLKTLPNGAAITHLTFTIIISAVGLFLTIAVLFALAYLLKTMLNIDLFPDLHLRDLF